MYYSLGRARLALNLLPVSISPPLRRPLSSLRSAYLSSSTANFTRTCRRLPRRAFSSVSDSPDGLFNYTSGHWLVNNDLRLAERRREFDVDELCRLAAQSVGRSSQDIDTFVKLAEGGFNRSFLITMRGGFEMVARIPYPVTVPKFYALASEVATMRFLRSSGLPVPEVYDYSPSPDNAAKTEYIFMEFIRGTNLTDVWMELEEPDLASVLRQMVQLESRMMSITFPAGGSLYYTKDLEKVAGRTGIPLNDERFCVGPDARLHMWYGRRSQLDVDRGPYENAEAALVAAARKEMAYLEKFGRPLLPFQRERRESYEYKEQSPSDHIKNLERYLLIASSLVPKDPALHHFRIRHPDLQPSNVIVLRSSDTNQLKIVGLLDWQHASILPPFLFAGIPGRLQNYDDPISQALTPPSLPANFDELDESEKSLAMGLYHRRLVHFHYVKNTEEYNKLHYDALSDLVSMFICRLFDRAGSPWEGETHALKTTLIEATELWGRLTGGGVPCPVAFEPEDLRETKELSARLQVADENFEGCRGMVGFEGETWVCNEDHEMAKDLAELLKLRVLTLIPKGEIRDKSAANWFLDDMDEEDYM
ncbi:protein kinase subdomain-containing protein PKL/CAK/Fmp29 [Thelephora terrestris]|uniref:Protein kinase subdomain-containing protein PKL/CAK/Fmp29 n=1 Tax=Thelephora terrestris TaxID=56493 RepID=A0A9P6HFB7_9AGAM|nr:protein kinase subdomain-containing protein PKL/CAK/Fmp29 [Thelephora terrestris]